MAKYKSTLYPVNLANTPRLIYEIGMKFREQKLEDDGARYEGNRVASNPPLVCKLFYYLYLTGSRIGEALLTPSPKCKLIQVEKQGKLMDVMYVEKLNLKHFVEKKYLDEYSGAIDRFKNPIRKTDLANSTRKIVTQQLPIDNEWEAKLWNYVLGKQRSEILALETTMDFSYFGGYDARSVLSHYISNNFETDLTDGEHVYKEEGIAPHLLRHLRAYSFLVEKGLSESLVQSYMGWSSRDMLEVYVYITKMLGATHQLDMLKRQISMPGIDKMPRYGSFQ